MNKYHLFIIPLITLAIVACSGNSSNPLASGEEADFTSFSENTLIETLAQNDSSPSGTQSEYSGSIEGTSVNLVEPENSHSHQLGGINGIFIIDGRLVIKGNPPQLGPNCDGVTLLPGSTESAGRIVLSKAIKRCAINFHKPFYNPVCIASGAANTVHTGTPIFDPMDGFVISHAGGTNLKIDVINYICLDTAKPAETESHSSGSILNRGMVEKNTLDFIQGQSTGNNFKTGLHTSGLSGLVAQDDSLEKYCANIKNECVANSSGSDAKHCLNSYNICVTKTDCNTLHQACVFAGTPAATCDAKLSTCAHDAECKANYDNCMDGAMTGGEGVNCNNTYQACLQE